MPIEGSPGFTPPGTRPTPTPLPPSYSPPIQNGQQMDVNANQVTPVTPSGTFPMNGFFGFVLLMMGLK